MIYEISVKGFKLKFNSDGYLLSLEDCCGANKITPTPFSILVNSDKTTSLPKKLSVDNNLISIEFSNGKEVVVSFALYNSFIIFTLEKVVGNDIFSVKFTNILSSIDYDSENNALCLMALTLATRMQEHPGQNQELIAEAFYKTGFSGNENSPYKPACAVIYCDIKDLSNIQNEVLSLVPDGELIKSSKGGPNAKKAKESSKKTYTLHFTPITGDNYAETVAYFKEAGFEQINLHHIQQYSQGSFNVNGEYYNSFEEYKNIVNRLKADGFEVGLHSYSFFISPSDKIITPIPHDDIDCLDEFTLLFDMDEKSSEIFTVEKLIGVTPTIKYILNNSNTLRIDNELIKFKSVDESGRFFELERGALGTKIASHKKGAKIRRYKLYFYHYLAKADTPLFFEIAKNTAKFYNEVGFDCVYFDALDGVSCLEGEDYAWYYAHLFIREFFNHIDHDPTFDCCHNLQYTGTWYARSRYGALDRPTRAYAEYIDAHISYNKNVARRMQVNEELGWLDLYPQHGNEPFYNSILPLRKEDIAYIYLKCMVTDSSVAYMENLKQKRELPIVKEHFKTVLEYQNFINGNLLTKPSVDYIMGNGNRAILNNGELKKASFELFRFDGYDKVYEIENHCEEQKPFIRIENLYSGGSYDSDGIVITDDIVLKSGEQKSVKFTSPINANDNRAVGVMVKGDGSGGVITIALRNYKDNNPKWQNYYVKNDFVGERYFTLVENQTGEMKEIPMREVSNKTYNDLQNFYGYYFGILDYACVEGVELSYQGEGEVELKPIKLLPVLKPEVNGLTIILGDKKVEINKALKGGETLEIESDGKARIIDTEFNLIAAPFNVDIPKIIKGKTKFQVIPKSDKEVRLKVTLSLLGEKLI